MHIDQVQYLLKSQDQLWTRGTENFTTRIAIY